MDCCDWDKCTFCGECLMKCPVMKMDKNEAVFEIKQLLEGEFAPRVFNECTLCFNCNQLCPEGLRPHELILQRVIENRKGKIMNFLIYLVNGMPMGNLFQDFYARMTLEEQEILEKWSEIPPKSKDILYIGCFGKMMPYDIEHSNVLRELPKFGPTDICCGELAYRNVGWECYSEVIERTLKRFEQLDIERMVCYCGSCYNFLSNILPNVYGKKLPFKLISMYEWMLEKLEKGELELKNPLNYVAAISESCYVSELGTQFQENLRKIYRTAGAELVELPHHGDQNLSCGMVSVARNMNLFNGTLRTSRAKRKDLKESGVKDIAINCPGCYVGMKITNYLKLRKKFKKIHYMPVELLKAFGDDITTPIKKTLPLLMKLLLKQPFKLFKKIDYSEIVHIPVDGPLQYDWKSKVAKKK